MQPCPAPACARVRALRTHLQVGAFLQVDGQHALGLEVGRGRARQLQAAGRWQGPSACSPGGRAGGCACLLPRGPPSQSRHPSQPIQHCSGGLSGSHRAPHAGDDSCLGLGGGAPRLLARRGRGFDHVCSEPGRDAGSMQPSMGSGAAAGGHEPAGWCPQGCRCLALEQCPPRRDALSRRAQHAGRPQRSTPTRLRGLEGHVRDLQRQHRAGGRACSKQGPRVRTARDLLAAQAPHGGRWMQACAERAGAGAAGAAELGSCRPHTRRPTRVPAGSLRRGVLGTDATSSSAATSAVEGLPGVPSTEARGEAPPGEAGGVRSPATDGVVLPAPSPAPFFLRLWVGVSIRAPARLSDSCAAQACSTCTVWRWSAHPSGPLPLMRT